MTRASNSSSPVLRACLSALVAILLAACADGCGGSSQRGRRRRRSRRQLDWLSRSPLRAPKKPKKSVRARKSSSVKRLPKPKRRSGRRALGRAKPRADLDLEQRTHARRQGRAHRRRLRSQGQRRRERHRRQGRARRKVSSHARTCGRPTRRPRQAARRRRSGATPLRSRRSRRSGSAASPRARRRLRLATVPARPRAERDGVWSERKKCPARLARRCSRS